MALNLFQDRWDIVLGAVLVGVVRTTALQMDVQPMG